jgi:pyruvate,orthophosphate dikinase
MKKLILNFKSKDSKKIKNPKNFLGGKGANLSEMGRMGLPVPPGFTISTKVCELFYKDKKKLNKSLVTQIKKELKIIEKDVGKKFGDLRNPLLTFGKIWSKSIYARNDGYNFKLRFKR